MSPTICPSGQEMTDLGCIPQDAAGFVSKMYGYGLGLIGGVSIIYIIYSGYLIIFSQGNPEKLAKGKRYLIYSVLGLIMAIFGFVFVQVIVVDILHIPGFS